MRKPSTTCKQAPIHTLCAHLHVCRQLRVFPHSVLPTAQLPALAALTPAPHSTHISLEQLAAIIGTARATLYGESILQVLKEGFIEATLPAEHALHDALSDGAGAVTCTGTRQAARLQAPAAGTHPQQQQRQLAKTAGAVKADDKARRNAANAQQHVQSSVDKDVVVIDDSDSDAGAGAIQGRSKKAKRRHDGEDHPLMGENGDEEDVSLAQQQPAGKRACK